MASPHLRWLLTFHIAYTRHLVTSPQAYEGSCTAGRQVRRPDCTLATADRDVPVRPLSSQLRLKHQGVLLGITCICGDSHTSTHGSFGSLAFGIGTSEVKHVLATQTLLQKKKRITVDGELIEGVTSEDIARMSICNMSIEAGAHAGVIAPDELTFSVIIRFPLKAKVGIALLLTGEHSTDPDAKFDIKVNIPASDIIPTVTWGTSPQDVAPITGVVPDPSASEDPVKCASVTRSLNYMGLTPNMPMQDIKIDKVFISSCMNSRIEDVTPGILAMIVPGFGLIKKQAETEGLDVVFKHAGFDWREAGCSINFEGREGASGHTHLVSPAMAVAAVMTAKLE
ncbi:large subunit of 3-isopropylmalate dehydratase [Lentinula aff. lateritia]|uniref:Large subunit of 3-isopropylmalate dehydratase n=1 Tax=Lentinula aff. lateritia TaxID=2804960 RepID=A0ACC1U7C2_9AGAR|nr:large subunit of 3-isopropylmalate dehydratase [Lentinula aff. lateritia]